MKMKLIKDYNYKNPAGTEVEIIRMKRGDFASGVGVMAVLNGHKTAKWLTVDWFLPEKSAQQSVKSDASLHERMANADLLSEEMYANLEMEKASRR